MTSTRANICLHSLLEMIGMDKETAADYTWSSFRHFLPNVSMMIGEDEVDGNEIGKWRGSISAKTIPGQFIRVSTVEVATTEAIRQTGVMRALYAQEASLECVAEIWRDR